MHRKRRSNSAPGDSYQPMSDPRISRRSPTSLTKSSMDAVSNDGGRAAQLTPAERRQCAKVALWPFIGDRRAPRCEPNVGERERAVARRHCGERREEKFGARRTPVRSEHYEMPLAA